MNPYKGNLLLGWEVSSAATEIRGVRFHSDSSFVSEKYSIRNFPEIWSGGIRHTYSISIFCQKCWNSFAKQSCFSKQLYSSVPPLLKDLNGEQVILKIIWSQTFTGSTQFNLEKATFWGFWKKKKKRKKEWPRLNQNVDSIIKNLCCCLKVNWRYFKIQIIPEF